jgi:cell filamentation protein
VATYPGTFTVKNKLGAFTHEELERLETPFVEARDIEIAFGHGPPRQFDAVHLKAIHRHLFQDVYEWAGRSRDERVQLSDGTVATEPSLRKVGGGSFLDGGQISMELDRVAEIIRDANCLRECPRGEFARRAADMMAQINAIHPFREGNGRTQRVFMRELASQAGHSLDFSVVSRERMVRASIVANEHGDPSMMRRMFDEISNPVRVVALREATEFLERNNFDWNDHYIATIAPEHPVDVTFVGTNGSHFMARTNSDILVGTTSDLPEPRPESGTTFTIVAREDCWE